MKSRTKITKQARKKLSPGLVETIVSARKNKKWLAIAGVLSSPRRQKVALNLNDIEAKLKEVKGKSEKIIIPGKILGEGELKSKVKIVALSFSKSAEVKLKKEKVDFSTINEEIKTNPEAKGIVVLR